MGWTSRWIGMALLAIGLAGQARDAQAVAPFVLTPVVTAGLTAPLYLTHAGDGSGRIFIVEQGGLVRVLQDGTLQAEPFLDVHTLILGSGERGLLGLAFHPDFESNGRFFIDYTRAGDGATVVAALTLGADPAATLASLKPLLTIEQPFANHNGGWIGFGPDGFLYIAMGDGGSGGDPGNRAQNRNELLGKILRIDVDSGDPYGIPASNPFANGGGRPEIYAFGFRNPWRLSFDRKTGALYAGDVGQNAIEEIDRVTRGGNFGWRIMEGNDCYPPGSRCSKKGLIRPIATYSHTGGRCSVTGGYVYRGRGAPALKGSYIYGDYCTGEIFSLVGKRSSRILDTTLQITSFGEDERGEVYVVGRGGTIHRFDRRGR